MLFYSYWRTQQKEKWENGKSLKQAKLENKVTRGVLFKRLLYS